MFRLAKSQVQPIGLDIGRDGIKMLQLEVLDGQRLSVRAAARQAFSAEVKAQPQLRMPAAVEMVRRMLRQNPFVGREAVVALPREAVHVKNFRLPVMPLLELESAVRFEARQLLSFDPDETQIRFLPAGEVRQGNDVLQEVIVLATSNNDVNNFVEQIHRCGVIVGSLDVEPCALFRTVERFIRRREDEQDVNVIVDVGFSSSQVVIGRGRDISFMKSIDIGGMHLHEAVSTRLGISLEEAQALRRRLVEAAPEPAGGEARDPVRQAVFDATRSVMEQLGREISLCLRYQSVTFRGHRPSRLRLFGGEAGDPQLDATLSAILTIPIEPGKPLYSVDSSRMKPVDGRGDMAEWAVALGLALRRTTGRFGARDGRRRQAATHVEPILTSQAASDSSTGAATLVLAAAEAGARPSPQEAPRVRP